MINSYPFTHLSQYELALALIKMIQSLSTIELNYKNTEVVETLNFKFKVLKSRVMIIGLE